MTEEARIFLDEYIAPRAADLDSGPEALRAALDEAAARGLLGLRAPTEFGGEGWSDERFREYQEHCARRSGAWAFLQTQHQSACSFVAKSPNESLRAEALPALASGKMRAGIAFAQLRRQGPSPLKAEPAEGGFVLDGTAPWFTGWGLFDSCVFAAELPDRSSVWALVDVCNHDAIRASAPMRLAAMESTQTVSLEVSHCFVPESSVLYHRPPGWIHESDELNIALQSPFALGCARAGIDVLRSAFEKKPIEAIRVAAEKLERELDCVRDEAYACMSDPSDKERALRARAEAIRMAGLCAHACVVASSGSGNSMSSPAQRVYREAIVFSVSAQTEAILAATLEALTSR